MRGSIQAWPTRPNKAASENPLSPASTETNSAGMGGIRTDDGQQGPVGPEEDTRAGSSSALISPKVDSPSRSASSSESSHDGTMIDQAPESETEPTATRMGDSPPDHGLHAFRWSPTFGRFLCTSGPEVAEADERLGAGVLEGHALAGPLRGDEDLVLGHLAEADEDRAVDVELADRAAALGDDQAVGAGVLDRGRAAGLDGQLAGAEELLAVDRAVDDPLVDVALGLAAGRGRSARGSCGP